MGTSGSSKGAGGNTSLVPTWLEEPAAGGPLPGSEPATPEDADPQEAHDPGGEVTVQEVKPRPAIELPPQPARFQGAKGNFSRFAGSGGTNRTSLRRAVQDYVRSGTRGGNNAARRMGSSRRSAANALGVLRSFARDGVANTLARFNLGNLAGRPPQDIFLGLTEVICRDGGSIDEAIARDAWLETVAEIDTLGIVNLDALTGDQVREIFLTFIAHAVETRIFQDIGANGFKIAADLDAIESFEAQFRSYVGRAVRDSFSSDFAKLAAMSDADIQAIVDRTYREAWDLLELLGDQP